MINIICNTAIRSNKISMLPQLQLQRSHDTQGRAEISWKHIYRNQAWAQYEGNPVQLSFFSTPARTQIVFGHFLSTGSNMRFTSANWSNSIGQMWWRGHVLHFCTFIHQLNLAALGCHGNYYTLTHQVLHHFMSGRTFRRDLQGRAV